MNEESISTDVPGTSVENITGSGRRRVKTPNSIHHLISRIAHRVYFLKEDERNDFISMMYRVADFTCIDLIGWCVMTNHFHIIARLPERRFLSEEEVLQRYRAIHTLEATNAFIAEIASLRQSGDKGESAANNRLDRLREKMFSIPWFMKILKEWFSKDYNLRTAHSGTMWEAVYTDRDVENELSNMAYRLAYVHLNPVRAGIESDFAKYLWSSLTMATRGDARALKGLRIVYGEDLSDEEMFELHEAYMQKAYEHGKRKSALEIAIRKTAGYDAPKDSLTDAAYVAQAEAHIQEVQKAGTQIVYENRKQRQKCEDRDEEWMLELIDIIEKRPEIPVKELAEELGVKKSKAYNLVGTLKQLGVLRKEKNRFIHVSTDVSGTSVEK